jgi:AraC-like DNA-binding protein
MKDESSITIRAAERSDHAFILGLAERFVSFVKQPPMQYLTAWRMQLATNYLRAANESISSIAGRVGYDSEAAFSRAFKKSVGSPPSEWREQHLATVQ